MTEADDYYEAYKPAYTGEEQITQLKSDLIVLRKHFQEIGLKFAQYYDAFFKEQERVKELEGILESLADKIASKGLVMRYAEKKALVNEARAAIGWHPHQARERRREVALLEALEEVGRICAQAKEQGNDLQWKIQVVVEAALEEK